MPTDPGRPQPVEPIAADIQDARALRPEQPLMAVGREEIDWSAAHVDGQRSEPLDRVDKQCDPAVPAKFDQTVQVVAEAAGELDVTDRRSTRVDRSIAAARSSIQIRPSRLATCRNETPRLSRFIHG